MTLRDTRSSALGLFPVALLALGAVHAPAASAATDRSIVCELGDRARTISLRSNPDETRVCDVLYEKPDEGVDEEVLWFAQNDPDYCTPHFIDLVERLAASGWSCLSADEAGRSDAELSRSTTPSDASPAAGQESALSSETGEASGGDPVAPRPEEAVSMTADQEEFRDWCVGDPAIAERAEPAESYCACLLDGLVASGTSDDDLRQIVDGIPSRLDTGEDGKALSTAQRSKELNTLVLNYDYVSESCR